MLCKCDFCDYEWESKKEEAPKQCPSCKRYNWDKISIKLPELYELELIKLKEIGFVNSHRKEIIKILGQKCNKCEKKLEDIHHTKYEGISKYHNDLNQYCEFLIPYCKKHHGEEKKDMPWGELGISKEEYKSKFNEYKILINTNPYFKIKIPITIDRNILNEVEKIKEFPQWKGNRSLVIETAVEEFIAGNIAKESKCIFCNKTECNWVILDRKVGRGVCSECSFERMQNPIEALDEIKKSSTIKVVDDGKRETKE